MSSEQLSHSQPDLITKDAYHRPHRFVSIDFLRGMGIWTMLFLHGLMRVYDLSWTNNSAQISEARIIMFALLLIVLYAGGWCGFFLLISAIGNMISMQKQVQRGGSVSELVLKQVVKGLILLVFAFLTESTMGYQGYMGSVVVGQFSNWSKILYRGYHMETIHTVAWCIILNGIVQGFLVMKGGYQKTKRNILIYAVLSVLVIVLTTSAWNLADFIIPGYPFATYEGVGRIVQYPLEGVSSFGDYILLIFLMPLAGVVEPVFPFLAVSFIGSIIGLLMMEKNPSEKFPRIGILISIPVILIGLVGVGVAIATGTQDIEVFLGNTYNLPRLGVWFWWFLVLTGSQVLATLIFIRLIEFRGKAVPFAQKTLYIRKFGFIAFTIYNYQYIDVIPRAFISLIPGVNAITSRVNGNLTLLVLGGIYLTWWGVMWLWEKVNYVGGMEWMIAVITRAILPREKYKNTDKSITKTKPKWWQVDRMNVRGILYDAQWINIIPPEKVDHANMKDSKLAYKLSFLGIFVVILAFFALDVAIESRATEGKNKYNTRAIIICIFSFVLFLTGFLALTFTTGLVL
jgi:hypothetical protein